jgi:hypothetical protein
MNKDQVIKSKWFEEFPIGNDEQGIYNFIDDVEQHEWEINKIEAQQQGWSEHNVTYNINRNGYRGAIESGMGVSAAFGCSCTFGSSVDEHHTWANILELANCGQPGSSNDKIARLAISYIKTFKPTDIYVCWTFPSRREWVDPKGNMIRSFCRTFNEQRIDADSALFYLSNLRWDDYNYEKNKMLLESICYMHNVILHQTSVFKHPHDQYPRGRDLAHPGPDWHVIIAEQFLNN